MDKYIIETREFSKEIKNLVKKRSLLVEDFEDFKRELSENPFIGNLIVGGGGARKARLKSATRGKSGGFRICYYYIMHQEYIYLLWIYPKNEQENLTAEEKNLLKSLVVHIKGGNNYD